MCTASGSEAVRFLVHDGRPGAKRTWINANGTLSSHRVNAQVWGAEVAVAEVSTRPYLRLVQVERTSFTVFALRRDAEGDLVGGGYPRRQYDAIPLLGRVHLRFHLRGDAEAVAEELEQLDEGLECFVHEVDAGRHDVYHRLRGSDGLYRYFAH